jgi:acetylornithine deacetylase/succinyl-diaminopimelate desuccinylase-like protein
MADLNALLASVDAARDEIVTLLQDLVRVPTVNTGPRPDTGDEASACALLRPKLDQAGIPYE